MKKGKKTMGNYQFEGMEKTEQQSVSGENIYRDYGTNNYFKEDYAGNKIECDQDGNPINRSFRNNNKSNGSNRNSSGLVFLAIIAFAGLMFILDWSIGNMMILGIAYVALTVITPWSNRFQQNFLHTLLSWVNKAINCIFGFSVLININNEVNLLNLPSILMAIIPLALGYFLMTFIQNFVWSIYMKHKMKKEDMSLF